MLAVLSAGCRPEEWDERIVLRVSNWGGPAGDPSFMKLDREILEEFERKNPNIDVQVENIPGPGQYVPKLLMMFLAGNPPDVVTLDASSAAVFVNNRLLTDLTPLIRAAGEFRLGDYASNVLDIARRGESLYAIPLDFTPMVIVYNKRLFDQAGVPYPEPGWTRERFFETVKALTIFEPDSPTPARYGFTFSPSPAMWIPFVWAAGADLLSPDGTRATGYLDSPATIEMIRFLADLIRKHRMSPSLSESAASGIDLFRAGKAAMTMTGHWALIEYRADRMDIGVAGIPRAGGLPVTVLYAAGLAISRESKQTRAAWDYIKYMTGEEVQRKRVSTGLAISANVEVAQSFRDDAVEKAFLEQVPHARPPWGTRVERYELVEDLVREMMEDIIHGGLSVQAAASETAALIDAELRKD